MPEVLHAEINKVYKNDANKLKDKAYSRIDYNFSGQTKCFAKAVIDEIFEHCEDKLPNYNLSENELDQAIDIIFDLKRVLSWGRKDESEIFYICFNWDYDVVLPWCNDIFLFAHQN